MFSWGNAKLPGLKKLDEEEQADGQKWGCIVLGPKALNGDEILEGVLRKLAQEAPDMVVPTTLGNKSLLFYRYRPRLLNG